MVESHRTAKIDGAAPGLGRELFDLEPILFENDRSVHSAESARQTAVRQIAVGYLQSSLHDGIRNSSGYTQANGQHSRRGEVGIEALDQLEIHTTIGAKIKVTFAG